jgi:hypothetical protein
VTRDLNPDRGIEQLQTLLELQAVCDRVIAKGDLRPLDAAVQRLQSTRKHG